MAVPGITRHPSPLPGKLHVTLNTQKINCRTKAHKGSPQAGVRLSYYLLDAQWNSLFTARAILLTGEEHSRTQIKRKVAPIRVHESISTGVAKRRLRAQEAVASEARPSPLGVESYDPFCSPCLRRTLASPEQNPDQAERPIWGIVMR